MGSSSCTTTVGSSSPASDMIPTKTTCYARENQQASASQHGPGPNTGNQENRQFELWPSLGDPVDGCITKHRFWPGWFKRSKNGFKTIPYIQRRWCDESEICGLRTSFETSIRTFLLQTPNWMRLVSNTLQQIPSLYINYANKHVRWVYFEAKGGGGDGGGYTVSVIRSYGNSYAELYFFETKIAFSYFYRRDENIKVTSLYWGNDFQTRWRTRTTWGLHIPRCNRQGGTQHGWCSVYKCECEPETPQQGKK